jgi:hypothetical protein
VNLICPLNPAEFYCQPPNYEAGISVDAHLHHVDLAGARLAGLDVSQFLCLGGYFAVRPDIDKIIGENRGRIIPDSRDCIGCSPIASIPARADDQRAACQK